MRSLIFFCLLWAQVAFGQTNLMSVVPTGTVSLSSGWVTNPFPVMVQSSTTGQVQIVEVSYLSEWTNSTGKIISVVKMVLDMNGRNMARSVIVKPGSRGYEYAPGGTILGFGIDSVRRCPIIYINPNHSDQLLGFYS